MAKLTKDMKALAKKAEKQGWRIRQTNDSHYAWYAPDGVTIIISGGNEKRPANHIAKLKGTGQFTL